ncbi:RagB/SusD family nutrient uptake outer membrane protein [Sphingobacterium olei]|uniref:RagB/SusD family nutrient uptake outer membrane protein n=1 Tax=Sphingobacterium olei TaxID=2571155 RepID=A0A4U0NYV3_9SPHI|nr:RagB/SusD family nutrient uptake outer membrane protein [Sphingobacterium olei]TJZ59999.1 RagB/SusD family nutrient uptake outer membrane protein [Sphingobacterium olei]
MKRYIKFTFFAAAVLLQFGCNDDYLDKLPETSINNASFFNTANDLDLYVVGLYNFSGIGLYQSDATSDNASTTGNTEIKTIMAGNASAETINTGWSKDDWAQLRKVNFYLANFGKAQISETEKAHYEGLGRYFRARFYVEKVQRFSDVPWIDKPLEVNDADYLFAARDPRDFIVQKIMEDFAYAAEHVNATSSLGEVNKWVVLQEFSRFALYEGTFRKYHNELNLEASAAGFLEKAFTLSDQIMKEGGFAIHNTGNPMTDYGSLFFNENLDNNKEVILGRFYANNVLNADSWPGMFGNYEYYPLRDLVQSYLMKDGSFFTGQVGYDQFSFVKEFENRDPRLSQSYAYPGWELIYSHTYAQGAGLYVQQLAKNFSGYHQIKGFQNTLSLDTRNNLDIPLYRYAEILLNFAEAKAELGILTQEDLNRSINVLRDRVAMPHLLIGQATDPVLSAKYANVESAQRNLVLEVRRERRVELAFEGYRFTDLMRWNVGKLLENKREGIYFSGLGKHDMTGDGIEDIVLLPSSASIPADKEKNSLGRELQYYRVGSFGQDVGVFLSEGNSGTVETIAQTGTFEVPKHYYRPIPARQIGLNNNLKQIFGW